MSQAKTSMRRPGPELHVHRIVELFVEITDLPVYLHSPECRLLHDVIAEIVPEVVVARHDTLRVGPGEPLPLNRPAFVDHVPVAVDEIGLGVIVKRPAYGG